MTAESVPVICPAVYVKVHEPVPPFAAMDWLLPPGVMVPRDGVLGLAVTVGSAVPPEFVTMTLMP
jgi:hypothetical protein